jgi:hypothetical protein
MTFEKLEAIDDNYRVWRSRYLGIIYDAMTKYYAHMNNDRSRRNYHYTFGFESFEISGEKIIFKSAPEYGYDGDVEYNKFSMSLEIANLMDADKIAAKLIEEYEELKRQREEKEAERKRILEEKRLKKIEKEALKADENERALYNRLKEKYEGEK